MRHGIKMMGLVAMLAFSACTNEKAEDNVGKFVGTWRATAGTITTTCPGYAPDTQALSGSATWRTGVSSDLVGTTALVDCPLMAEVTSATASGLPGQPCTWNDSDGYAYNLTLASYTFVMSPDERTATENCSGQLTVVAAGASFVCVITESGSYQKISN